MAKYVVMEDNVGFDVLNDERLTVLTATFPLLRKRETLEVEFPRREFVAE